VGHFIVWTLLETYIYFVDISIRIWTNKQNTQLNKYHRIFKICHFHILNNFMISSFSIESIYSPHLLSQISTDIRSLSYAELQGWKCSGLWRNSGFWKSGVIFQNSYLQFTTSFWAVWKWIIGLPKQLKSRSFRGPVDPWPRLCPEPTMCLPVPWPPASFSGFQFWATFTPGVSFDILFSILCYLFVCFKYSLIIILLYICYRTRMQGRCLLMRRPLYLNVPLLQPWRQTCSCTLLTLTLKR